MVSKTIAIAILIVLVTIISLSVANRKHASLGSRVSLWTRPNKSRRLKVKSKSKSKYKLCDSRVDPCGGQGWCNTKDPFLGKSSYTRYYCYMPKNNNWGCSTSQQCKSDCCVGGQCIAKPQKKKGSSCSEHCECKSGSCTGFLWKTCDD